MSEKRTDIPFTSRMSAPERALAIGYLPIHVYFLPMLLVRTLGERIDALSLNVVCYVIAAFFLFFCLRRFFFREFNALCDYGAGALLEVAKAYGVLLLCNLAVNVLLVLTEHTQNPNNDVIFSLAGDDLGKTAAMAVFLAPIAEEAMFRGGVFGLLRRYSRLAAYGASMALFALYHVWSFALGDPTAWLYLLQYLPAGFLLARVYENTESLWTAVFLHMTVNGVSMLVVSQLGAFL